MRIIIVNNKAFAIKRLVRKNDFRASGSGNIIFDKNQISEDCLKIAFKVNKSIKSQSIAFDFVIDSKNSPFIVEISYGYASDVYQSCEGYWTEDLRYYPGMFNPQSWMIENIIEENK